MLLPAAVFGLQRLFERKAGVCGVQAAAQEDVGGGVVVFRPGVDADVRFGQQQHAGDAAVAAEAVEMGGKYARAGLAGGLFHGALQFGGVAQRLGRAAVQVKQAVAADGGTHLWPLPPKPPKPPCPGRRVRGTLLLPLEKAAL